MLPLDKLAALNKIIGGRLKLSPAGVDLIASFEGFSATPYNDPAMNATIGYGILLHLGPVTQADIDAEGDGLTEEVAKRQLAEKAQEYADCMKRSTAVPLNQNQYDALTSFTYNLGCGGYINSAVRVAVEKGTDVRDALMQYIHGSDGVAYPGLIRRRQAEGELFYAAEVDMPLNDDDKRAISDIVKLNMAIGLSDQQKHDVADIITLKLELFRQELANTGQLPQPK